jgi:hypothetical protein
MGKDTVKYQLVLQFPENLYGDLDWITETEDRLIEHLMYAVIDGHEIGRGEVNIFILTNNPFATFESVKNILEEESGYFENAKIAYRDFKNDTYICLWPANLAEFVVS